MSKLTDVVVDAISLVKAGANREPIQVYKAADGQSQPVETTPEATPTEPTPAEQTPAPVSTEPTETPKPEATTPVTKAKDLKALFEPLAKALGFTATEKSRDIDNDVDWESFSSRMNRPSTQISDALYTLNDCLWEIFWNDQIDNGRELILQNIDEFKTFVTQVLDSNKERQNQFFTKGETEVTKTEVQEIITAALEPAMKSVENLGKKIEALGKEDTTPAATTTETPAATTETPAATTETPAATTETPAAGTTPAAPAATEPVQKSDEVAAILKSTLTELLDPITKSIEAVSARVETVENTRGLSNGLQPSGAITKGDADQWPEINIPGI